VERNAFCRTTYQTGRIYKFNIYNAQREGETERKRETHRQENTSKLNRITYVE